MSQLLHDTFIAIADEVDVPPAPPGAAGAAWRTGRRRVVRRRVTAAAVTVLVGLVMAALVWPPHLPQVLEPAGSDQLATGHPLRVTKPWFVRALPANGKPLAGLALSSPDHDPYSRSSWLAIDVAGDVYALPGGPLADRAMPAVSPDGRLVAYSEKSSSSYVVRNVVNGTRHVLAGLVTVFPDTPDGKWTGPPVIGSQVPAYWAPDGRHLAARITRGDGTEALAVISPDGSWSTIAWSGAPLLAGWVDDTRLLAVDGGSGARPTVSVSTVDIETGVRRQLPNLQPEKPFRENEITQWSPALSADGRRLAISRRPATDEPLVVAWASFDLATGAQEGSGQYASHEETDATILSRLQWRGDDVVTTMPMSNGTVVGSGQAPPSATMLIDPRLDAEVVLMAQRALAGPAHGSLWGHSTSWFAWRWKECLAALGVAVLAAVCRRWDRQSRA